MNSTPGELSAQDRLAAVARSPFAVPLLIAGVVTALVMGVVVVAEQVAPQPFWRLLPTIIFLVALEGIFTTRWLHHPDRRLLNRPAYRLAEIVFILFLLRLLAWALTGGLPDLDTVYGYLESPLTFFDPVFFVFMISTLFAWERASAFAGQLSQLALSHAEIRYYTLPAAEQRQQFEDRPVNRSRPYIFAAFIKGWLSGGALVAFFAAVTTVDIGTVTGGLRTVERLGLQPKMLGSLLVYFIGGLLLVSHARLVVMHARWVSDGVEAAPRLMRNWRRASVALIVGTALLAALLPIGSTFGLARLLELFLGLMGLLFQLAITLAGIIAWLFTRIFRPDAAPPAQQDLLPAEPLLPPDVPLAGPPSAIATFILSGLFWVTVGVVTIASLLFFLRERGITWKGGEILGAFWANISAWLASFWRSTAERAATAQRAVRSRLSGVGSGDGQGRPWRFIRLGGLSPREQIRYFYLSTVRRAGERGVARDESETPSEFADDLMAGWPEAAGEIEQLTDAFLEARYSRQEIEDEDLSLAKTVWKEVRAALRRKEVTTHDTD